MVLACFDIGIPDAIVVTRTVFDYDKADWTNMKSDIVGFDWTFIDQANVDDAERYLHNTLFTILRRHTPERLLLERKSKHPWVNDRCLQAIHIKNLAVAHLILLLRHHLAAVYYLIGIYCTSKRCGISWVKNDVGVRTGGELQTI